MRPPSNDETDMLAKLTIDSAGSSSNEDSDNNYEDFTVDVREYSYISTDEDVGGIKEGNVLLEIGTWETMECPKEVAKLFAPLSDLEDYDVFDETLPIALPGVDSLENLARVIEWCEDHLFEMPEAGTCTLTVAQRAEKAEIVAGKTYDIVDDRNVVVECFATVQYLNVPSLVHAVYAAVNENVQNMTKAEVWEYFARCEVLTQLAKDAEAAEKEFEEDVESEVD